MKAQAEKTTSETCPLCHGELKHIDFKRLLYLSEQVSVAIQQLRIPAIKSTGAALTTFLSESKREQANAAQ